MQQSFKYQIRDKNAYAASTYMAALRKETIWSGGKPNKKGNGRLDSGRSHSKVMN
jgi:hypothetical protein